GQRYSWLEPSNPLQHIVVTVLIIAFLKPKGCPEECFARRKAKIRRHYSDHCVRLVIERDWLPDDFSIASKRCLPQGIAQHDRSRGARLAVLLIEITANQHRPFQQRK